MELRPYQTEAVDFLLAGDTGFVVAPAGSGKTIIAAAALGRLFLAQGGTGRALWLANTREQVQQAETALLQIGGPPLWDRVSVQCVAGSDTRGLRPSVVIVDEAHHVPARTWSEAVVPITRDGTRLWGFSATPWAEREPERDDILKSMFGRFHYVSRDVLVEDGHVLRAVVTMHDVPISPDYPKRLLALTDEFFQATLRKYPYFKRIPAKMEEAERRAGWRATQELLLQETTRNSAIVALATTCARNTATLVLVPTVAYGSELASWISARGWMATLVHSKLSKKTRAEALQHFAGGYLPVLVATSLADEGLDVPRAGAVILALGGRSSGKLEQRVGRVLRPFPGKTYGEVHDFLDKGAPLAYYQAVRRFRTYQELGYSVQVTQ